MTEALDEHTLEALEVARACKALLAGRSPDVQGAVLVELLALFLAGHAPELRRPMLKLHLRSVIALMQVNAKLRENLKQRGT